MRSTRSPSWIERLAGLVPVPVPPHVLAFGPEDVRYGRFVRAESGFEVEAYAEAALAEESFGDGPLGGPAHDAAALTAALDELGAVAGDIGPGVSVVLPDEWLRVAFVDLDEVPRSATKREEVLRWKLKRTVPFRVEDLRLASMDVAPLGPSPGRSRWLLCFGLESLLGQIESVLARRGLRVGQIVAASLATASSVHEVASSQGGVTGLVTVTARGYGVTFLYAGQPVLHRFRPLDPALGGEDADSLVVKDLRLTRTFLREHVPDADLASLLLTAPPEASGPWLARVESGFERPAVELGREQLPFRGALPEVSVHRLAPMIGAACQEAA